MLARRERVADIMASRQWLLQQPWVARDRISLMGWANGASALLWAVRPQLSSRKTEPDFRSAIAFYPDCRISSGLGWSARVPTLLLIGAKDDVSSPPACRQMVDGARGRSALARIVVYPGAYHDFDRANLPLHAIAGSIRCRRAGARPSRHRRRSARRFAKARRGMAGAVDSISLPCVKQACGNARLKQASLADRLDDALGRGGLRFARCSRLRRPRCRRPIGVRGRRRRVHRQIPDRAARPARPPRRHARRGPARRAPAQNRAPARCDRTAPPTIGRYGRRAPGGAASRSPARAARARPAAARVRGRARCVALRLRVGEF